MWEVDCEEGWAQKNWSFGTVVLEKTLESALDCKGIQPVHSEGDQPWDLFGRNDAKAETPVLLDTSCEELTHWKWLWCWEGLGAGGEGDDRGWDGWMASLSRWMWVWVNSGSWWWTGRPGVLQFMESQRVGHDWATELNWTAGGPGAPAFDPIAMALSWEGKTLIPHLPASISQFTALIHSEGHWVGSLMSNWMPQGLSFWVSLTRVGRHFFPPPGKQSPIGTGYVFCAHNARMHTHTHTHMHFPAFPLSFNLLQTEKGEEEGHEWPPPSSSSPTLPGMGLPARIAHSPSPVGPCRQWWLAQVWSTMTLWTSLLKAGVYSDISIWLIDLQPHVASWPLSWIILLYLMFCFISFPAQSLGM